MLKRKLHLTTPHMHGADVSELQSNLGIKVDGEYGPLTASAVDMRKKALGFRKATLDGTLNGTEYLYFTGARKPGPLMKLQAARYRKSAIKAQTAAENAVDSMLTADNTVENPAGSNKVPLLQALAHKLGISKWYQAMGWPWCAFSGFLYSLLHGSQAAKDGFAGKFNVLYCPSIAAEAFGKRHNLHLVSWAEARKGDIVLFTWFGERGGPHHFGRIVTPIAGSGFVATVEGNTSSSDGGSQSNGGGIYKRVRDRRLVSHIIRET